MFLSPFPEFETKLVICSLLHGKRQRNSPVALLWLQ
jgi:hypothetical protein